jgi:aconitase B
MEDAGALPIEIDVANMNMGDEIVLNIDHAAAKVTATKDGAVIAEAELKTPVLLDEVRAGGRINLIVGRGLTAKAREALVLHHLLYSVLQYNLLLLAKVSLKLRKWLVAHVVFLKVKVYFQVLTVNLR